MSKRRRTPARAPASAVAAPAIAASPRASLRKETDGSTIAILALMAFLTPTLGVPHEEMLQDTLKSAIVSSLTLGAALAWFWQRRTSREGLRWHAFLWFPVLCGAYALGAMAWSHTYLGGVEAVRWFICALLLWLVLNTGDGRRALVLALGIHAGAFGAAFWGVLQYLFDLQWFPQGRPPASTFANRNFASELVVTSIPFGFYVLSRLERLAPVALTAAALGVEAAFLLMTSTRSAWLACVVMLPPMALWAWRVPWSAWPRGTRLAAAGAFGAAFLLLVVLPASRTSGDMVAGLSALGRARDRLVSEDYSLREPAADSATGRLLFWQSTLEMIEKNPLAGVGAGAWEVEVPRYKGGAEQLEGDYYAHNELLQHVAEYGLVGWLTLGGLVALLCLAAWRTLRARSPQARAERELRWPALSALAALMVVGLFGFPWHLAATDALFMMALGLVAASDARLGVRGWSGAQRLLWSPRRSRAAAAGTLLCLALAAYVTRQAVEAERSIVRAVRLSLGITESGRPNSPEWEPVKREIKELIHRGIELNPHYRKLTPMVADELVRWGDWASALPIYESVIASRPYVPALLVNLARGNAHLGRHDEALAYLERAKAIAPANASVRTTELILLVRRGRTEEAYRLARRYFIEGPRNAELVNATLTLAEMYADYDLVIQALERRSELQPETRAESLAKRDEALEAMRRVPEVTSTGP